ncbi:MAG: ACP S-malonyltransferase [Candidatus Cloacimonetes bacterium]|nr:ACP S-malonyltransferase [Candidatus Cloacimonadota bacterium]
MNKTAFIFPGQGAQYVGMAMDFIDNDPSFREILLKFDRDNGTDLYPTMQNGSEEELKETPYTQPAVLFHSIAALRTFQKEISLQPDFVAGHSLGEFTALTANGVLNWSDALYLVHKRGEFMIKANQNKPYAMAAIIGLSAEQVKEICQQASPSGTVIAVNFNTPIQTVISGSKKGVEKACELAADKGAARVVPLAVGGPFHTPLIAQAAAWLTDEFRKIKFSASTIPVISNVDARPSTSIDEIKLNLARQVTSPVLWVDSIRFMIEQGVSLFLEFGPRKVLAGMIRKIDNSARILSVDKMEDIREIVSYLRSSHESEK